VSDSRFSTQQACETFKANGPDPDKSQQWKQWVQHFSTLMYFVCLPAHVDLRGRAASARDATNYDDEHKQGRAVAPNLALEIYREFGAQARHGALLQKCGIGYERTAAELNRLVDARLTERINALLEDNIKLGSLQSMGAVFVARESVLGWWVGYRNGFGEGARTLSLGLPPNSFEAVCKNTLQEAEDWIKRTR
jgi:hypothetical protein